MGKRLPIRRLTPSERRIETNPQEVARWLDETRPIPGRWARVPTAAALDRRLSAWDYRVLIALGHYVDRNGHCYPPVEELADRLGVSRQMVQKSIRRLEAAGWLLRQRQIRIKSGGWAISRYHLIYPALPALKAMQPLEVASPSLDEDAMQPLKVAPMQPLKVAYDATSEGCTNSPKPSSQMRAQSGAAAPDFLNGHDEDQKATPGITTNSDPAAPPQKTARRRVSERPLVFPHLTSWLHAATERERPGAMTPAEIDRLLVGYRLKVSGGFEDEKATAPLEMLVLEVLSRQLPEVLPLDALHVAVHARNPQSALHDMRQGMAMAAAYRKHCEPQGRPS